MGLFIAIVEWQRWFALVLLLVVVAWGAAALADHDAKPKKLWVFVGTYTDKGSKGIYRCELDLESGRLSNPQVAAIAVNPSFLALDPSGRFLYAVGEVDSADGKRGGSVSAFAFDRESGSLVLLNRQSTRGAGPCHLTVDRRGRHVLAANYGSGSMCVLPIRPDGSLGESTGFVQHRGSSVNPHRQEGPHAHSVNVDPAGRVAFVADLGLDKVMIYKLDPDSGTLKPNDPPSVDLAPGAGPRHFAFHPGGRFAYVINELDSTLTALAYDAEHGVMKKMGTVSTLPKGSTVSNTTAEVQVHPSGRFVYGSNRGHDSIAIFAVDPENGTLSYVGHQGHHIKTPRNFGIDPTGTYLLVANQDADSVVAFRIDPRTGQLTPTGSEQSVPTPVCVKMIR